MKIKTKEQASAYLAGFIDGEGCIYFRNGTLGSDGKKHWGRVVTVSNTDYVLINVASKCLKILGIEHGFYNRPGATSTFLKTDFIPKHLYILEIRKGPAMWRFRELVPIQSPEKKKKLDGALESYKGIHCVGCGCLYDTYSKGCKNCIKRKYFRDRTSKMKRKGQNCYVSFLDLNKEQQAEARLAKPKWNNDILVQTKFWVKSDGHVSRSQKPLSTKSICKKSYNFTTIRSTTMTQKRETIFVFGSNLAGVHGAGSALYARQAWGAQYGIGIGRTGQAYAIPTKDKRLNSLPVDAIHKHIADFIIYAKAHPKLVFHIVAIGCGLAGYKPEDLAESFRDAPSNCILPKEFRDVLESQSKTKP